MCIVYIYIVYIWWSYVYEKSYDSVVEKGGRFGSASRRSRQSVVRQSYLFTKVFYLVATKRMWSFLSCIYKYVRIYIVFSERGSERNARLSLTDCYYENGQICVRVVYERVYEILMKGSFFRKG